MSNEELRWRRQILRPSPAHRPYFQIHREDAVLECPQSGERIRGRRNIQASRFAQPSRKRFTVRRVFGAADLWITELVIAYDAQPSYTVSIMEFRDGKVARETQYFLRSV